MILIGAMIALWGALVMGLARPLHEMWKGMLSDMRRSGVRDTIPGTKFFASTTGLRRMRIAGGAALAIGVALALAGLIKGG